MMSLPVGQPSSKYQAQLRVSFILQVVLAKTARTLHN